MLQVSAPGRVCLFGEHQDYLHLAVIPAAINKRCFIQGNETSSGSIRLEDKIYNITIQIPFNGDYKDSGFILGKNDYLRAVLNVFIKRGLIPKNKPNVGFE